MEKRWVYMDIVMASLRLQLGVAFNVNESKYQSDFDSRRWRRSGRGYFWIGKAHDCLPFLADQMVTREVPLTKSYSKWIRSRSPSA